MRAWSEIDAPRAGLNSDTCVVEGRQRSDAGNLVQLARQLHHSFNIWCRLGTFLPAMARGALTPKPED